MYCCSSICAATAARAAAWLDAKCDEMLVAFQIVNAAARLPDGTLITLSYDPGGEDDGSSLQLAMIFPGGTCSVRSRASSSSSW
jgi:hypothetical protein